MKGKEIMECLKLISEIKDDIPERTVENAIAIAKKMIAALNINTYPVPIVKVLNNISFSVFATEVPPNLSGFMIIDKSFKDSFGSDKIIAIDKNDEIGRQRFTLAHELSHYLFDYDKKSQEPFVSTFNMKLADTEPERVANKFAAEFLMPEDMFRQRYNQLNGFTEDEVIRQLVDDFNATSTSVKRRLEELGLKQNG